MTSTELQYLCSLVPLIKLQQVNTVTKEAHLVTVMLSRSFLPKCSDLAQLKLSGQG